MTSIPRPLLIKPTNNTLIHLNPIKPSSAQAINTRRKRLQQTSQDRPQRGLEVIVFISCMMIYLEDDYHVFVSQPKKVLEISYNTRAATPNLIPAEINAYVSDDIGRHDSSFPDILREETS